MPLIGCPSCATQLRVGDALLGKKVKCPRCATVFAADASAAVPPSPPPLGPPSEAPSRREDDDFDDGGSGEDYRLGPRRDGEPHRGPLILTLGIVSVVLGATSLVSLCCFPLFGVVGLAALPLGIITLVMGRRDLRQMDAGLTDAEGRGLTTAGAITAIIGTITGSLAVLIAVVGIAVYVVFVVYALKAAPPGGFPPPAPPVVNTAKATAPDVPFPPPQEP